MNLEGLDCWDDYPMEHGCICGNDCTPPPLPLDPEPWLYRDGCREDQPRHLGDGTPEHVTVTFSPRPGYNQNREDYTP